VVLQYVVKRLRCYVTGRFDFHHKLYLETRTLRHHCFELRWLILDYLAELFVVVEVAMADAGHGQHAS
jgi:hypothetical protein